MRKPSLPAEADATFLLALRHPFDIDQEKPCFLGQYSGGPGCCAGIRHTHMQGAGMGKQTEFGLPLSSAVLLATVLAAASWNARGAETDRGRMLHDTHCVSCHDSKVYKRDSKVATDYDEIRKQVVRWETNVSLHWSDGDIDAVTTYLARTFYKVPCSVC